MEKNKGQLAASGEGSDTAWLCIHSLRLPPKRRSLLKTYRRH